ncbi:MAG: hypothetical protein ABIE03_04195 [Patescibacteria group bacterium]|nr:hypothetical protein [Patescibacteria group bacterium]
MEVFSQPSEALVFCCFNFQEKFGNNARLEQINAALTAHSLDVRCCFVALDHYGHAIAVDFVGCDERVLSIQRESIRRGINEVIYGRFCILSPEGETTFVDDPSKVVSLAIEFMILENQYSAWIQDRENLRAPS